MGIFDVNDAGVKTLAAEIGTENCFSGIMDVADPQSVCRQVAAFSRRTSGRMDVLVNNAGILNFGLFETLPLETHFKQVDVNFKGSLAVMHAAIPFLKQTPGARIINMSSVSSVFGVPDLSVYAATKHALSAMTEALNIELEKHGIFVCDIRPPYVKTPLLAAEASVRSIRTLGVHLRPEQVARVVWQAAHRKKLHWNISTTRLVAVFFHIMPFAVRRAMKILAMPRDEFRNKT